MIYQEFIISDPGQKLVYRGIHISIFHAYKQDPYKTRQDVKYLPTVTKIST